MNREAIEQIHESFVNGQRRQAVKQIDTYGNYEFWEHYKEYLSDLYTLDLSRYEYFTDATISYMRIKNR